MCYVHTLCINDVVMVTYCSLTPNYPSTVNADNEDFLVVHPTRSPQSHHHAFYSMGMDLQTGTSANMVS